MRIIPVYTYLYKIIRFESIFFCSSYISPHSPFSIILNVTIHLKYIVRSASFYKIQDAHCELSDS